MSLIAPGHPHSVDNFIYTISQHMVLKSTDIFTIESVAELVYVSGIRGRVKFKQHFEWIDDTLCVSDPKSFTKAKRNKLIHRLDDMGIAIAKIARYLNISQRTVNNVRAALAAKTHQKTLSYASAEAA